MLIVVDENVDKRDVVVVKVKIVFICNGNVKIIYV